MGILPYGNARDGIIIFEVVTGEWPPCPTDTWWLQDHVWNMLVICWSDKREQRLDIGAICNQLSTSSIQEVPKVEQGNQYTFSVGAVVEGLSPVHRY